ncbi:MAG: hypothetical protein ACKN8W_01195 [Actinomycetales bacterium]|jgi:hypothetical protein
MMRQALILASGERNPEADTLLKQGLEPFVHKILDLQRIDLGHRTIIGLLIECDPAHLEAIESDLVTLGEQHLFDVALELL